MKTDIENLFKDQVLGHPGGLFVLFFTEMWERFSFYGMRVLLINFLTMTLVGYNPGWEWSAENAGALFGTYTGLLYLTPIIGGMIADRFIGYRWAVILGSIIMTFGHVSMAFETELSLYVGLGLLVIGTGFFKPNITSIISTMYSEKADKKDGAYTIFYMGVNAGAFFGMLLCGYLAEKVGWSWGFGLAGVFMLFGTAQFWLSKPLFGSIGDVPKKQNELSDKIETKVEEPIDDVKRNPFTLIDKILVAIVSVIGFGYLINDPLSKIKGINFFPFEVGNLSGQYFMVIVGLILFLFLSISRIIRFEKVVRDRMIAFIVFAFFTVFFWMSFEQGASSLIIFARDNVDRILSGNQALLFNIINSLLTIIPLGIITWVLILLWQKTRYKILGSNIVLFACFSIMWGLVIWMLNRDLNTVAYDVVYQTVEIEKVNPETGELYLDGAGNIIYDHVPVTENMILADDAKITERTISIAETTELIEGDNIKIGEAIKIIAKDNESTVFGYLDPERLDASRQRGQELGRDNGIINAKVVKSKENEVEITVSWFSILNSFFIIAFASLFSSWWDSKYNPSAATKYALGLIIMAVGFGLLAFGSWGLESGVKVSMIWLVLAYLFHTLGELCLSPVGLSYVSKLVPARMIAFMFGMWYLAIAIGNKLAAVLGGQIENITKEYDLATFFLIFTIVPTVAGIIVYLLNPKMKKLMHGVH